MLSLFACDRAEFGKASTDDRVSNEESSPVSGGSDGNNAVSYNNGSTSGAGDPDRAPQVAPSLYPYFTNNDNFVFAPKSVSQTLNALSLLASGTTKEELVNFQYAGLSAFSPSNFASVWIDDSVEIAPDLVSQLSNINVDVRQISLASSDTRIHINNVAREDTDGYLSELIPPVEALGGDFIVTTGSYYTIAFRDAFDVERTYENTFFGDTTSDRDFMVQSGTYQIVDNEELTALAIEMEYERVLVLMMPKGQIEDLEVLLSAGFIDRLLSEMELEEAEVHIPKMDFVNTFTFSEFIDFETATFSNLAEDAELGAVLHQVRFILNEEGVDVEQLQDFDDPSISRELRFDRPFVFSVYDPNAQDVELLGRITN